MLGELGKAKVDRSMQLPEAAGGAPMMCGAERSAGASR
jgi:hypothetical protein